ncbi:ABC transporter permease [Mobilicoccus pelagius]|uniref:Putative ABC transporter permease protein n=1 Tax=Mobilicoccus pelagius NBRC 104925 TaxID=1089455 RepID=H5UPT9_9MICO|nr:ABC transporter permease [Mobilicoccus pelagius]GAB47744.1 putative ABC transporter permease protein [Mobilicoccus pelagius NBRC 104925]
MRILRRVLGLLVALVVSSVLVFAFMQILPGDPARVALGLNASEESVARLRAEFGLDRPLHTRYLDWIGGLLTGDFGTSYLSHLPIGPQIADRFGVTAWLVAAAMIVAVVLAVPLGTIAAWRHRHPIGAVLSAVSQVGMAIPSFLAGVLLIAVFAVRLRLLPAGGWTPPSVDVVAFLRSLVLPALALGLVQAAVLTRYVRSAILDVLREDYLRTARAKGFRPLPALVHHGLRNASIPVVTVLALQLTTMLVGAVVVERVFVVPGLGSLLLDAVASRDLLVVQDVVMVLVVSVLTVNLLVEVLYAVLDPRSVRR